MQGFPKCLLFVAFFNLVSLLLSVFFLFGGLHVFGTSGNSFLKLLLYIAEQLLWLLPVASFFASLKLHDYDKKAASYLVAAAGCALTILNLCIVIL